MREFKMNMRSTRPAGKRPVASMSEGQRDKCEAKSIRESD
jgi:hypothetical protein